MNTRNLFTLGVVLAGALTLAACSTKSSDDEASATSADALSTDSLGVTCRTLGEIGQCGATTLCRQSSEAQCKAKASAIATDPDWDRICRGMASEMACGWQSSDCFWEQTSTCIPRSGATNAGAVNIATTCGALGELGACGRVSSCKSSMEGMCRATDDALAADPQWAQMCPRAGTNEEACNAQSFCTWEEVNACTPRAVAATPLDLGTACRTLGEDGACGLVSVCKSFGEPTCVAKESAIASDPDWIRICRGTGNETACGWQSNWCTWESVDQCVPLSGPRTNSNVDRAVACDSFGQVGQCSRAPFCKPVQQGTCRATANALAGDPSWATQCPQAGSSQETCAFMAPSCVWEPLTRCVPR